MGFGFVVVVVCLFVGVCWGGGGGGYNVHGYPGPVVLIKRDVCFNPLDDT